MDIDLKVVADRVHSVREYVNSDKNLPSDSTVLVTYLDDVIQYLKEGYAESDHYVVFEDGRIRLTHLIDGEKAMLTVACMSLNLPHEQPVDEDLAIATPLI